MVALGGFFSGGFADEVARGRALDVKEGQLEQGSEKLDILRGELQQKTDASRNKQTADSVIKFQGMLDTVATLKRSPNKEDQAIGEVLERQLSPLIQQNIQNANESLGTNTPSVGIPQPSELARLRTAQASQQRAAGGGDGASAKEEQISRLTETGEISRPEAIAIVDGRLVVSRDPVNQRAEIIDKATGQVVRRFPIQQPPTAATPTATTPEGTALPTEVDFTKGVGAGAFFARGVNIISDMFAGKIPFTEQEAAAEGLSNLQIRTRLTMQSAVPGRPSKFLLEQLGKLAIEPRSLLQGQARSFERLKQTRGMIQEEVSRIDRDVLANPEFFTPQQVAKTRASRSELRSLLKNYDVVVDSFQKALGAEDEKAQKFTVPPLDRRVPNKTILTTPRKERFIWRDSPAGKGWERLE